MTLPIKSRSSQKIQSGNRSARLAVSFAIQEALEVGRVLKRLNKISEGYKNNLDAAIKNRNLRSFSKDIALSLSSHEIALISGALRDYITDARDNWIGHMNARHIGPVNPEILYGMKVTGILEELNCLVCTEGITIKELK